MLEPGDHVICVRPAYQSLYEHAISMGCNVSFWDCKPNTSGKLVFQVDDLEKLMKDNTRAVFVNFPHNPTGFIATRNDWEMIVNLCKTNGAYLFSDEMYRLLELDPQNRLPAAFDCYEKAVSLSGMSKSFGMAGVRLGWLATKDAALRSKIRELHDYASICHVGPAEILALIGLKSRETIVEANRTLILDNLKLAAAFFQRHNDIFEFVPPDGSSICFPRLTTGEPIEQYCERLLKSSGVLLLPATMYDSRAHASAGHFRLGLGRKTFATGLQAFEDFVNVDKDKNSTGQPIEQTIRSVAAVAMQ